MLGIEIDTCTCCLGRPRVITSTEWFQDVKTGLVTTTATSTKSNRVISLRTFRYASEISCG